MFYVIVVLVLFLLSFTSLAASLWIIGEADTDPFNTDGVKPTLLKCAGISAVTTALHFVPIGGLIVMVVWLGSVMAFFDKSFLGAILIALVGGVVSAIFSSMIISALTVLL